MDKGFAHLGTIGVMLSLCIKMFVCGKANYIILWCIFPLQHRREGQRETAESHKQFKLNQILLVTYTWLADVNASVVKCLCFKF